MTTTEKNVKIDTEAMRKNGFWWCGRCLSLIPITYWHTCTDTETRSGYGTIPVSGRTE